MANSKVKVVIAFDRDNSKIGKTIEVTEQEARLLISEGRAAPAGSGKDAEALRKPAGPTTVPPGPQVVGAADLPAGTAEK